MDNRSHDETSWDFELLGPELMDLQNLGFGEGDRRLPRRGGVTGTGRTDARRRGTGPP